MQESEDALAATGHREEDALTTRGQRRVNLLWEGTQSLIALGVIGGALYLALAGMEIPQMIQNIAFLIVGFYFSRTNHEKIGGVGPRPDAASTYRGR